LSTGTQSKILMSNEVKDLCEHVVSLQKKIITGNKLADVYKNKSHNGYII